MKTIKILILFCIGAAQAIAQSNEFKVYKNGLIYSEETMSKLSHIVDSLNLKFKICDLDKTYEAKPQGRVNYVIVKGELVDLVAEDLKKKISYNDLKKKYKSLDFKENIYVTSWEYTNYEGEYILEFSGLVRRITMENPNNFTGFHELKAKTWLYRITEKDYKGNRTMLVYYLVDELIPSSFSEKYSRMVQYTDCLIDTTATSLIKELENEDSENEPLNNFIGYIYEETKKPEYNSENYDAYRMAYQLWDSLFFDRVDRLMEFEKCKSLFQKALDYTLINGGSSETFESLVNRYSTKENLLQLKRSRKVYGSCGMDQSPRIHAFQIAVLSAEVTNWEVFLRAHLNIMNDNFSRITDGSYAWEKRNTYIKELEDLDINVADLLLGISLRIHNPVENHYYGSIRRIGRALTETKNKPEIENRMLEMIMDEKLDLVNRDIISRLFLTYINYQEDESYQKELHEKLVKARESFPEYALEKEDE